MKQQEAGGVTLAAPVPSAAAAPSVTPLWLRTNHADLTPFCLSAKSNASEMFTFLLEESKQIQWTFGSVSCVLYPLKELDLTISKEAASEVDAKAKGAAGGGASNAPVACKEHPGALELIMNAGNVDLLMHPRLLDLVSSTSRGRCGCTTSHCPCGCWSCACWPVPPGRAPRSSTR